jgi:eukaryotic-like serine/threonine-protein kinase
MTNPPDRELAVFSGARRFPPGQRAAYLDEACGDDKALRQRVEALLEASEDAGAFLPQPGSKSAWTSWHHPARTAPLGKGWRPDRPL